MATDRPPRLIYWLARLLRVSKKDTEQIWKAAGDGEDRKGKS